MKIKRLSLQNFRGVMNPLEVIFDKEQSFLLYGDNGTGKSSFADSIEWFISDDVSHLSGEEVETHGGLKNISAKPEDPSFVQIMFQNGLEAKKELLLVKDRFKSKLEPSNPALDKFLSDLSKERLWIRNKDLLTFILDTKSRRLADISQIIGYEEVAKVKTFLKKTENSVRSTIKTKNFEGQIAIKKALILEKLNATVNNQKQFYSAINSLLEKNKINLKVTDKASLDIAIQDLQKGTDESKIIERQAIENISKSATEAAEKLTDLLPKIVELKSKIANLNKDQESLKKLSFSKLYDEAAKIIASHNKNECPLCLQGIDRHVLQDLISNQIDALKDFKNKSDQIETDKISVQTSLREIYAELKSMQKLASNIKSEKIEELEKLAQPIKAIEDIGKQLGSKTEEIVSENINFESFENAKIILSIKAKLDAILKKPSDDDNNIKIDLITKISVAEQSLTEILTLQREKVFLDNQLISFSTIASEFNLLQSKEMDNFLNSISKDMNDFYIFMNTDEKVDSIELSSVKDANGEFVGIAVKLKFHGQEILSPKKYLSESHLNCLGLCLFLSSVKLFNKFSKFLVLDDVISSFDKNHRMRFGQLLLEKFSDYQLIVLTHETEWFDFMCSQVKGIGWRVNKTVWDIEHGTNLDLAASELKEKIEEKIKTSNADGLGVLLRKFGERLLKNLSVELNAELAFRFNDRNERRNFDELFSSFRRRIKEKSDIADSEVVKRLSASQFFANSSAHEGSYNESLPDLKAVYADLLAFENLFMCAEQGCKKVVSLQNHNKLKKVITCKCGSKELAWKD